MFEILGTEEIPQYIIDWARSVHIDIKDAPNVSVYEANVGYCVHVDEPYRNYYIGDSQDFADRDWHLPLYINLTATSNTGETHIIPDSICCGYAPVVKDESLYPLPTTFTREDMYKIIDNRFMVEYPTADRLDDDELFAGMRRLLSQLSNPTNNCRCINDALEQLCQHNITPFNYITACRKRNKKVVWLN